MFEDLVGPAWHIGAVFLRIGAAFFLMPVFGEAMVPRHLRLITAFAVTLLIAPLTPSVALPEGLWGYIGLLGGETIAGLTFGVFLRSFVWALQILGSIAAQAIGVAQILGGGVVVDPAPAVTQLLVLGAVALLCAVNWPLHGVAYLAQTYTLWPMGQMPLAGEVSEQIVQAVSRAFSLGFQLAAPFYLVGLFYNAALGVISRAMPQLMVALIGAPALTGLGFLALFASVPLILSVWLRSFMG